jgi:L-fucose mutarotase/ribose pyranase (RbsD/FucU family)
MFAREFSLDYSRVCGVCAAKGDDIMSGSVRKQRRKAPLIAAAAMLLLTSGCASRWQNKLATELPVLGHRNWVLVADSAYPAQSRAGIETIATGTGQIEVVGAVLEATDAAKHVRANVYVDAEMQYVSERDAPGIETYRRELGALLGDRAVKRVPHEDLIAKLDEAAKTFRVLILKTDLTLPYTSVFFELDCGYWSAEAEQALRRAMGEAAAEAK